jgi:HD superfamily phosphodiesterase
MILNSGNFIDYSNEEMKRMAQILKTYSAQKKILDNIRTASNHYSKAKESYSRDSKVDNRIKENREKIEYFLSNR